MTLFYYIQSLLLTFYVQKYLEINLYFIVQRVTLHRLKLALLFTSRLSLNWTYQPLGPWNAVSAIKVAPKVVWFDIAK